MGPTIYTNPEYEQMGYSGMFWQEFDHQGFHFRVTSGSTSYGVAQQFELTAWMSREAD